MVNKVPEGWKPAVISEIADINPKRSLPRSGEIPYLEMAALSTESPSPHYLGTKAAGAGGSKFTNGDTLVARITPCAENGKGAFVQCLPEGQNGVGSTEFIVLSAKPNITEPKYIYYLTKRPDIRHYTINRMRGTSGRQRIPYSVFDEISIDVPPLPEQNKITAILSSVDEAIEATEAVIEQTRTVKKGLLQELLTRGIGHTEFKKTAIGEIPKSWAVKQVRETGDVQLGRQRSPNFTEGNTLPYLRVANVYDGYIDYTDVKEMKFTSDETKQYSLLPGDVLLNEGQSIDLVGRSSIYDGMIFDTCCFQNTLIRYRAGTNSTPEFMQAVFSYLQYSGVFSSIATQTTSVAHLGGTRFSKLKIPVPPKYEQIEIARTLNSINNKTNNKTLKQLQILKRGLLQDLLTGKVRVNTLDLPALLNAEAPAEALAE
ncbi:hypothetical protein EA187_19790 [Lujinxingia sediminis]|uniref:Type I restriction modification DNA specificity domain-containing protein n=1 Tax=Lujinxingia sediminis TaxID=2480984 RepID=A0ABY0CMR7_9DELT|nr:restriction endonuclease subunit S [Lujinxingia sediminis]RVU40712.1 hypothetical protein EA187_19790 [Lujinxingia sediminis]